MKLFPVHVGVRINKIDNYFKAVGEDFLRVTFRASFPDHLHKNDKEIHNAICQLNVRGLDY